MIPGLGGGGLALSGGSATSGDATSGAQTSGNKTFTFNTGERSGNAGGLASLAALDTNTMMILGGVAIVALLAFSKRKRK